MLRSLRDVELDGEIPRILIGAMCDLSDSARRVTYAQGAALADEYGIPFMETSAKTGANIHEAFLRLVLPIFSKARKLFMAMPASTSSLIDWATIASSQLFRFGRRLGGRINPVNQHMRYDGTNGAVFAASLVPSHVAPLDASQSTMDDAFAVKIIFNVNDFLSSIDIRSNHEAEFKLLQYKVGRCGDCENVVPVYTHFIDTIDIKQLPQLGGYDISARTMFAVMPFIPFSLRSLIDFRKLHAVDTTRPLLNEEEVIHISLQMAKGLLYLQSKGIVHRDCKPDNVLIRPPDDYNLEIRIQIQRWIDHRIPLTLVNEYIGWDIAHLPSNDLLQSLVTIMDLGEHYDAHEFGDFKVPYPVSGMSRGGASAYYSPEVALARAGKGSIIDFGGMDAWALGMCMYEMMATPSSVALPTIVPWNIPTSGLHPSFSYHLRTIVELLFELDIDRRLTLQDAVTLLGRQHQLLRDEPSLQPDNTYIANNVRYCAICRVLFGIIINRGHHCRRCWLPCCDTCSSMVAMVPHSNPSLLLRMCKWC